jgi:hypothetical protein
MREFAVTFLVASSGCSGEGKGTEDTGEPAPLSAAGVWTGNCSGEFTTTTTTAVYALDVDSELDLTDEDGVVEGVWTYTLIYSGTTEPYSSGYRLEGERVDANLTLDVTGYTTSTGTTTSELNFDLTIAGDSMSGDLVLYDGESFDCTFTR